MKKEAQREIQRKKRVLEHAKETGCVIKTCRYFGIPKSSFYRWRAADIASGDSGLNEKPIPKSHPWATSTEVVETIIYLRRIYHHF
ncbi:MAG: hypothetical protein OER96_11270 [Gammaproteobacteria bacterium]|nr:hypothetical protein [Gammaproteobacteria bacterium]